MDSLSASVGSAIEEHYTSSKTSHTESCESADVVYLTANQIIGYVEGFSHWISNIMGDVCDQERLNAELRQECGQRVLPLSAEYLQ